MVAENENFGYFEWLSFGLDLTLAYHISFEKTYNRHLCRSPLQHLQPRDHRNCNISEEKLSCLVCMCPKYKSIFSFSWSNPLDFHTYCVFEVYPHVDFRKSLSHGPSEHPILLVSHVTRKQAY